MLIHALHDTAAVPKLKYSCLQLLEQRSVVERQTAILFFSNVRRHAQHQSIVLDCRAREHVNNHSYLGLVQKLHAVIMAEHIPPHQQCTVETREAVKKWLQVNCNLKYVFLMDAYPTKSSLHGNNMLTRVLKYLGLSQASPIKVCLLDCGLHEASKNKIPVSVLRVPAPVTVALVPKKAIGDGLFIFPHEFLKAEGALEASIAELGVRYVLNLTRAPTGIQGARELGVSRLPLKTAADASQFMIAAMEYLLAVPNGANVILIDTALSKIASEILVSLLIIGAGSTYESAVGVSRDRLSPPEFDSFARAAFMLLAETPGSPRARMEVAFAQLAGRFDPEHTLVATTKMNLAERWKCIQKLLVGKPVTDYTPTFDLINKLCNNILMHPQDAKYKRVRMCNPRVTKAFSAMPQLGPQVLEAGGWIVKGDSFEFTGGPQQLRDLLVYMNASG